MDLDTILGSIHGYDNPYESQPQLAPENSGILDDLKQEQGENQ